MSRRYAGQDAECLIFTFKEGLLSAVAHDLKLRVTRATFDVSGSSVSATFDATSVAVLTARRDGHDAPGTISASDKRTIEENVRNDVLDARTHPEIRFVSTSVSSAGEGHAVAGDLTLHGTTRSIAFTTRIEGDKEVAEVTLHQPDFGIKPYRAMLGTLRVQPDVRVRVEVPVQVERPVEKPSAE